MVLKTRCWGATSADSVFCVHGVAQHGGIFEQLGEIFSRHRGDRRVSFEMELPARLRVTADVSSQIRVRPSTSLIAELEQVVGQGAVSLR